MQISIETPDEQLRTHLRAQLSRSAANDALGQLAALAEQAGLAQKTLQPTIRAPALLMFSGDHGAITAGASARPQKITWQNVERILSGQAPVNAACRQNAVALAVIDAGISHDFNVRPGLLNAKIAHGTANYAREPAMWRSQLERALEHGRALAFEHAAAGGNVLGLAAFGVGARTSAALLTHCMTDIAIDDLTALTPDCDAAALARRRALLGRALARAGRIQDPFDALCEYGGFESAMLTGALLGAAEKRMLIVLDGFIANAALLLAARAAPAITAYTLLAARTVEHGHERQVEALGMTPLLDFSLGGDGTAAALAMPLLRTAIDCLHINAGATPAGHGEQNS